MRVLVVVPDLSQQGGVTNYYNTLKLDKAPNIDYFFANKTNTKSYLDKILGFVGIYTRFVVTAPRYQLIHVNPSLNLNSFYRDFFFILASKLMGKRVIVFFRGWDDDFEHRVANSRIQIALFRHGYSCADAFIVLGDVFKQKLLNLGVNPSKPIYQETTVADSTDADKFNPESRLTTFDRCVNILFISRIVGSKGIYIAIDAFRKCQKQLADRKIMLHVAGDGEELTAVKGYAREKCVHDIVFTGNVTGVEKYRLLRDSHILLFPTYYGEGMPNCILEAMLYGMPIISRVNGAIPAVVIHGINGFLTESKDPEEFSKFCIEIIRSKEHYKAISEANRAKATAMFSTEKVRERILRIYAEVCDS